jgi:hypothetical protein
MQENQYLAEEGVIILSLETLNMLASTPQMPLLIEKVIGKNRNSHKFKLYTPNELRVISKNDDITLTSCFSIQVPPQGAIYVLPNCNTPIPVKSNTHLNLLWKDGKVPPESHYVNLSMEIRNFDSQI